MMVNARRVVVALLMAGTLAIPPATVAARDDDENNTNEPCHRRLARVHDNHPHRPRLKLVGVDENGHEHNGRRFRADQLREIQFIVEWGRLGKASTQRLEVFDRDGHLFQSFSAEIEHARMETSMAVGGTQITQYNLLGEWCVEVYLEGVSAPLARRRFILAPSRH